MYLKKFYNKSLIIRYLKSTQREGIEKIIEYMNKNNFFEVPSSRNRHHNWPGGLAQHSLGVLKKAIQKNNNELPQDSIILSALLHDICKTRQFYFDEKGKIKTKKVKIPGHGYRSHRIIKDLGLELTEDERLAIRWHMGNWPKPTDIAGTKDRQKAENSPLWKLINAADRSDAAHHPPKK